MGEPCESTVNAHWLQRQTVPGVSIEGLVSLVVRLVLGPCLVRKPQRLYWSSIESSCLLTHLVLALVPKEQKLVEVNYAIAINVH